MFNKKTDACLCPFLKKPCIQKECELFVTVRGNDPQTNEPLSDGRCAIAWMPILQIENSKEVRSTHAGITNLRNENERRHVWWVEVLDMLKMFPKNLRGN